MAGVIEALAVQTDGHAEVIVKDAPASSGNAIGRVLNYHRVEILSEHGDYAKIYHENTIRKERCEGYARQTNLLPLRMLGADEPAVGQSVLSLQTDTGLWTKGKVQSMAGTTVTIADDDGTAVENDFVSSDAMRLMLRVTA
mmetsp:Transcript_63583/g.110816  ORF Transcript_63583/g.110816 Transcript_63583/m.110816 type:complete len:141 (-) Transcript_63583:31-453(-)